MSLEVSLNCDGSRKLNSLSAGAGSVLRDHEGRWLGGCCRKIGRCTSLQAELWALLDGLDLAWNLGFRDVFVQVDCLTALSLVRSVDEHPNANASLLRSIQRLMQQDWRIRIAHVYREGNRCADFLANYALTLAVGNHTLEEPPDAMKNLLRDDAEGVGTVRLCHVNL
ncbi:hypothetical protein QN277_028711 [Acacia crassicarpa]|uniref:RNase H type-1 domain-containing protein n=1 Tax=Acacia crassicarpa TaxID=499986 RepID=A0AAE1MFG1_9FABA|nr:hypothetical protein QN277_028711 [Acacia crassicarpa]